MKNVPKLASPWSLFSDQLNHSQENHFVIAFLEHVTQGDSPKLSLGMKAID
jgi:hypothetical protein